ncbi:unnamed protein product [Cylicostephanus goldi]|uniref:Uncharacterized protein n=1 Tax=Cylicostephanus goldi TaxID=71465 RepID=A0A3P6S6F9_CYLGO|nr:unnamed protein product [Cylicostephanus goldi]
MGWDISFDDLSATAVDDDALKDRYSIQAFEWLQECYVRQVIVEFAPGILTVRKPRGHILRKMIFPENADVIVYHSLPNASTIHGPYCLIKLRKTHDLVLRLPSDKHLPEFLAALTLCLKKFDGRVTAIPTPNEILLDKAETKVGKETELLRTQYSNRAVILHQQCDSNPVKQPNLDKTGEITIACNSCHSYNIVAVILHQQYSNLGKTIIPIFPVLAQA